MNLRLFLTLADIKRLPLYLSSILFASQKNILLIKKNFKGMLSLPEGVTLYKLSNSLNKNSIVVEIGCYKGLSTAFILSGSKSKAKVYSIDPFDHDLEKQLEKINKYHDKDYKKLEIELMKIKPSRKSVERSLKDNGFNNFKLIEDYSFNIARKWTKKINMLWIDGNHDYKAVEKDFKQWSRFIRKGGIIVFHDANKKDHSKFWSWGWKGPTSVVNKYLKEPQWTNLTRIESIAYAIKNY